MKPTLLKTTALVVAIAFAAPGHAQTFTDRVVDSLRSQGFTPTEVKNGPTETKVEAVRGNTKVEVVYDRLTGRIVEQEQERFFGTVPTNGFVEVQTREEDFSDAARGRGQDDDDDDRDDDNDRDRDRSRRGGNDDGDSDSDSD